MTVVGQPVVDYSFDNANRLTGLTQGTSSVAVSYDSASRRTNVTLPNGVVAAYTYDDFGAIGILFDSPSLPMISLFSLLTLWRDQPG